MGEIIDGFLIERIAREVDSELGVPADLMGLELSMNWTPDALRLLRQLPEERRPREVARIEAHATTLGLEVVNSDVVRTLSGWAEEGLATAAR
jgi:hypothetical protein